ncbi:MAG TPA: M56 family metallopeptidase [Acidobacteriaceae bacterium]|jgi:beta-lactamase regulating signal transducer with metallopeptidase domain
MDPSLGLVAASGLVNFLLKTAAEWVVCLLLVRIAGSARIRFNLWLTMLLAFVAQWVWMWAGIVRAAFPAAATTFHAEGHAGAAAGARIAVAAGTAATVARSMAVLLACYLTILVWRMMGSMAARVRLARAMRHKSEPPQPIATSFHEAIEQTAGRGYDLRGCELWVLPGLPSPATVGWWRPRVIVPPVCETQDAAELEVVFWHELMHVERRDALWNALIRACHTLLWFHPCVPYAVSQLNAERELACDAAVVREHPQSRDIYASCLLRFARARDLAPEPAVAGIEMASSAALLTTRVRSILSEAQSISRVSRAWRATVSMGLVAAMAATVPALNILFAAELGTSAMLIPRTVNPITGFPKRPTKLGSAKPSGAPPVPSAAVALSTEPTSLPVEHDGSLAAEHRAAIDVLTESTGMDTNAALGEGHNGAVLNTPGPGRGIAGPNSPSWTSVAVDAAERMRPMMTGRDADDRHYR